MENIILNKSLVEHGYTEFKLKGILVRYLKNRKKNILYIRHTCMAQKGKVDKIQPSKKKQNQNSYDMK